MDAILKIEDAGGIRLITINRPEKLNALNHATFVELQDVVDDTLASEGTDVAIITGAGPKAFVAGADIGELSAQGPMSGREFALFGQSVFTAIEQSPKPFIAAVNGFALGGGCELAMACHFRIASRNARFGQPEVNLGIIPGYGGTQRLARIVGMGRAAELLITGAFIDADEAHRIGLVNRVVEGDVVEEARNIAETIRTKSQVAVRFALQALHDGIDGGLQEGLAIEAALFGVCCGSEDFREGTTAFLEKRPPTFSGR